MPFIHDPGLHIEKVYQGLEFPTSIAFLNQSDIIVLEKNRGTVNRITNGSMHEEPLIDVNVSNLGERGLLGVATSSNLNTLNYQNKDKLNATYVFL